MLNEASTRLRRIETKPAGRVLRSAPSPKLELPRLWSVGDLLRRQSASASEHLCESESLLWSRYSSLGQKFAIIDLCLVLIRN